MTVYNSPGYAGKLGAAVHGVTRSTNRMHETINLPATLAAGDTINVAYLPVGAVVSGVTLKAASQLDSGATPSLAFDVGTTASSQLFNAGSGVGRSVGASADATLLPTGRLYKNTSGAKQAVIVTVHAAAASPTAGTLEIEMNYFVEELCGSPA